MIKGTRLLAAFGLIAGLGACGDDAKQAGETTPETTTPETTQETAQETTTPETVAETTTPETVAETTAETTVDTTPTETVTPNCDQNGITGESYMDYNPDSGYVAFGLTGETNEMVLEFYDLGEGSPLTGPGDYPLGDNEADQNYATCTTCALIFTETSVFFATEGLIKVTEIDEVGRIVKATLSDAAFVEVTINEETFESTPVPNGQGWCIDSVAIEYEAECAVDADCEGATPFCNTEAFECVGCLTNNDCTAENPVCDGTACIAGITVCTGDDANENSDDGPKGANDIAVDGTDAAGKICGVNGEESGLEFDYYTFTLAAEASIEVTLAWAGAEIDFDFYLINEALEIVDNSGATEANPEVVRSVNLAAGTYYLAVNSYAGVPAAALDYTLSLKSYNPECTKNEDCTDALEPACDLETFTCVVCISDLDCAAATPVCLNDGGEGVPNACGVVDFCEGDDADVNEHSDDGVKGATVVTFPTEPIKQMICGDGASPSGAESDYFKVTIPADGSLSVKLEWVGAEIDLDVVVIDATGAPVGEAATAANPEETTVSGVEAGDYFVVVYSYEGAATTALEYTLTMAIATP